MFQKVSVLVLFLALVFSQPGYSHSSDNARKPGAKILLGPVLSIPQPGNIRVWWHLSEALDEHRVAYGLTSDLPKDKILLERTAYPYMKVPGIRDGERYFYRVGSEGVESEVYSFKTPLPGERFRMGIWADNQGGWTVFKQQTVPMLLSFQPDVLLAVGDLVDDGSKPEEWHDQLYGPAKEMLASIPWFPVRGNHDGESLLAHQMCQLPENNRWYAVSYGPMRLVVLDSNLDLKKGSEQYEWLKKEVGSFEWESASYRLVAFHHPPFTNLWDKDGYNGDWNTRLYIVPLLTASGADVILSGHSHSYQHGLQVMPDHHLHYFIAGGGGGALDTIRSGKWPHMTTAHSRHHVVIVDVTNREMAWKAVDSETGEIFDEVIIPAKSLLSP